ncbi:hypothetical protein ABW19_dt0209898 [Dactylella cylindrospora]|nr:hypothetical protein ABW19_dt0209898 [Dactylella cylindrospora]
MATTLLNLPPSTPSNADTGSDPGTPASGISTLSTTAIKDGHEGHHPRMNMDVAAERVARLGGIGSPPQISAFAAPTRDYFEREPQNVPHTPGTSSVISSLADEHGSVEGDAYGTNSTQAKRESMAALLARRQQQQLQQQQLNSTPTAGPTSGGTAMNNNVSTIAPAVSPLPRASNAPDGAAAGMYSYSNASRSTDSPASTQTTTSAAEARVDAKLIDGMTYDEGDTTGEGLGRRDTIRPGQIPPGLNFDDDDVKMDG